MSSTPVKVCPHYEGIQKSTIAGLAAERPELEETVHVDSCAVVQFIDKYKSQEWNSIAKANDVRVHFDSDRSRIIISGAPARVQRAKSCFQELISSLFTDTFTVDKPGAKEYFTSQGSLVLSKMMADFSCVVVLRPDNQEEEKADMCSVSADAVVNSANEELQHLGGLSLALLRAAGPQLQKTSDDYIAKNGRLSIGAAIVTDAGDLPCKYIVHTVGPRFSDFDQSTAVKHLKQAVQESLRQAKRVECSSIALPAISSGVFGFPVDLCADTIAEAVREYCDDPQGVGLLTEIQLVDNNDNTIKALASAVNKVQHEPESGSCLQSAAAGSWTQPAVSC
uniref:Macro domain-containing protein n=1 Tax=Anabas testudineus TaxID=64144 RepID=A0A3Q1IBE4_ANATE